MEIMSVTDLQKRMDVILKKIPKEKWKYFHKKSICNFINYLPKINSQEEKIEIKEIISNYLDAMDTECENIDMDLSQALFNTYVIKLIQKYDLKYSFVPVFGMNVVLVFVSILLFLFYLLLTKVYLLTALSIIVGLYVGRIFVKLAQRKVYGFRY